MAISHISGHLKVQWSWLWNAPLAELPWKGTMVRSSSVANTWNHVKAQCITTPDKSQCFRPFKRSEPECNPWCLFSAFRHGVMLNYCIKDINIKSWKSKICTAQKLYAKNNYPGNMHLGSVKFMSSDSLVMLIQNPSDINNALTTAL